MKGVKQPIGATTMQPLVAIFLNALSTDSIVATSGSGRQK